MHRVYRICRITKEIHPVEVVGPQPHTQQGVYAMSVEQNKAIVHRYIEELWSDGDLKVARLTRDTFARRGIVTSQT